MTSSPNVERDVTGLNLARYSHNEKSVGRRSSTRCSSRSHCRQWTLRRAISGFKCRCGTMGARRSRSVICTVTPFPAMCRLPTSVTHFPAMCHGFQPVSHLFQPCVTASNQRHTFSNHVPRLPTSVTPFPSMCHGFQHCATASPGERI
jgi:hypothetical protein